jgi:hypothetical protein
MPRQEPLSSWAKAGRFLTKSLVVCFLPSFRAVTQIFRALPVCRQTLSIFFALSLPMLFIFVWGSLSRTLSLALSPVPSKVIMDRTSAMIVFQINCARMECAQGTNQVAPDIEKNKCRTEAYLSVNMRPTIFSVWLMSTNSGELSQNPKAIPIRRQEAPEGAQIFAKWGSLSSAKDQEDESANKHIRHCDRCK